MKKEISQSNILNKDAIRNKVMIAIYYVEFENLPRRRLKCLR